MMEGGLAGLEVQGDLADLEVLGDLADLKVLPWTMGGGPAWPGGGGKPG